MLQNKWNTFDKFQKIMLCILAAMVVLFAILMGMSRSRFGVYFHDSLLEVHGTAESGSYHGESHGETVNIVVGRESETAVGVSFAIGDIVDDSCLVEYPLAPIQTEHGQKPGLRISCNGEVLFEGAYDPADYSEGFGYWLYGRDGKFTSGPAAGHAYGGGNNYWTYYEPNVDTILRFANGPELVARGWWGGFFAACIIALMAALITAFPYELFRLKHCWYVEDPEPTDFYYASARFGSVILSGTALILFILALRAFP